MPKIIDLSRLLPEDFVIDLNGQRYTLPGDPPLELIIKVGSLFERSADANGNADEVGMEILTELDAEILKLLQIRDPSITASPFGVIGVQQVVAALLQAYNFGEAEIAEDVDENDPDPPPASRSQRSSGSPSSSTSSNSNRRTGARSAGRSSKSGKS